MQFYILLFLTYQISFGLKEKKKRVNRKEGGVQDVYRFKPVGRGVIPLPISLYLYPPFVFMMVLLRVGNDPMPLNTGVILGVPLLQSINTPFAFDEEAERRGRWNMEEGEKQRSDSPISLTSLSIGLVHLGINSDTFPNQSKRETRIFF